MKFNFLLKKIKKGRGYKFDGRGGEVPVCRVPLTSRRRTPKSIEITPRNIAKSRHAGVQFYIF